jgi:hypothetical protein
MLAALLPALRDLRTPLAVGYLWLIFLWLAFHRHLPDPDTATGLSKDVIQLGQQLGRPIVLAALTFAAYILGSITTERRFTPQAVVADLLEWRGQYRLASRLGLSAPPWVELGVSDQSEQDLESYINQRLAAITHGKKPEDVGREINTLTFGDFDGEDPPPPNPITFGSRCMSQITGEFGLMSIRLQVQNRDLFETYDRKRSEGEFRVGTAIPLCLIIPMLALQSSAWWLILLPLPVMLAVQGRLRLREAKEQIVQALVLGIIEAPFLQRLEERLSRTPAPATSPVYDRLPSRDDAPGYDPTA